MRTRALLAASIVLILAATSPPVSAVGTKIAEKQQEKQIGAPEITTSIMVANFPTPNVAFSPAIAADANAEQSIELASTPLALVDKVASNGRSTSTVQYANGPPMSQQTMLLAFESTTTATVAGYDVFLHGTPPTEVAAGTTVYGASEYVAYLRPSSQTMFNSAATYSMMTGTYGRAGFGLART